jgi:hypothetical protein
MGNEEKLHIEEYDTSHLEDVRILWREQYAPTRIAQRERLFRWMSEQNPFLNGGTSYFLLYSKDRVVGMDGFMPIKVSVRGERKLMRFSHDTLFREDCRGKGYFNVILQLMIERVGTPVAGLWPNENMLKSCVKKGWLSVPNFYSYLKIFDPALFLKNMVNSKMPLNVLSCGVRTLLKLREIPSYLQSSKGIEILEIDKFDDRFDSFFENVSGQLGITIIRTKDYLNWKFVDKPFNNYRRYIAFDRKGELSGYMVTKKETVEGVKRGKILDIFAHPQKTDIFSALVKRGVNDLHADGVGYLGLICTFPAFLKEIRKLGFIRSRKPERLMLYNWEQEFERGFISNINNWYLTYSDSDGDSWEVDSSDQN